MTRCWVPLLCIQPHLLAANVSLVRPTILQSGFANLARRLAYLESSLLPRVCNCDLMVYKPEHSNTLFYIATLYNFWVHPIPIA